MQLRATQLAGDAGVTFASAGTHGFDAHAMDDVMSQTLAPRETAGLADFRSRPLTRELLEEADVVLTAESTHRQFILDDHPGLFRKVFTLGQFAHAVEAAGDLTGHDLLAEVAQRRGSADASLDVSDPYRRGPEAAEAAATRIDDLLRVVVPALVGSRRIPA